MCGISGAMALRPSAELSALVESMASRLHHRGPDDRGLWTAPSRDLVLGHNRLAVVDLSPAGHQPMTSHSGRFTIVFNGEIYNHKELRNQGRAYPFRGHSDTEVILAGLERHGLLPTLKSLVGMFALAIYDREDDSLSLARDRAGEKPLYYCLQPDRFLFASELQALALPSRTISRAALFHYLRNGYVPAPLSILNGAQKALPGHCLILRREAQTITPRTVQYWAPPASHSDYESISGPEATEKLEGLLRQSVAEQMVADVPLGAFLSGGIDSTTIVALMQELSPRPVRTFTIGFQEKAFDESLYARRIAEHLNTEHTEWILTAEETRDTIPEMAQIYDEPFSDPSQVPTALVCKLARRKVTVALSGDAGDELFQGYSRYAEFTNIYDRLVHLSGFRPFLLRRIPARAIGRFLGLLPHTWRKGPLAGERLRKAMSMIGLDPWEAYSQYLGQWVDPGDALQNPSSYLENQMAGPMVSAYPVESNTPVSRIISRHDFQGYLPDDVLVKVDRAAMAVSLETRAPLLDHRIVEFAYSLPESIRTLPGKALLRAIAIRRVPTEFLDRPKMGFGLPLRTWLRGPLREWAEDLLNPSTLESQGYLKREIIHRRWREHIQGRHDWSFSLWTVLMFQSWLRRKTGAQQR